MNLDFLTGLIFGGLVGATVAFAICGIIAAVVERSEKKATKGKHDR